MVVFHVILLTANPRQILLSMYPYYLDTKVLFKMYPHYLLNCKDVNGKLSMDYLVSKWTERTRSLLDEALESWSIGPLVHWGAIASWKRKFQAILEEFMEQKGISVHRCVLPVASTK